MNRRLRRLFTSTSRRTFVLYPALVAADQVLTGRRWRPVWTPLLAWGYLQYRLAGQYRIRHGGGGPGFGVPPERIVDTGIYARTRNPMYLGHLVFLAGLALTTRSPLAGVLLAANVPWFDRRARRDEQQLATRFGRAYLAYRDAVPRWLPKPTEVSRDRP